MKACMLYFSISTAMNYVSLTKHFMHIYKVEVLWYVTLFMLLTTGSLMDCHQNCLWNVKFLISNAHNYLCRIQECWKKNSAMTIILKIISWRKYLPRNRKLTCSSKNSVISGVIVTWTKLHPVKQSNVWKKTRIFRSVSDNSLSFDCEISEKLWSFIKSIMLGSWTVCCDVTGGTKAVLHSEPARCQRTTVRQKK